MTWNLVVDSSSDMLEDNVKSDKFDFEVVPLVIQVEGHDYVDNGSLDVNEMLEAMKLTKKASTTACPSPEAFYEAFIKADCTICVTISAALSGTNNCAQLARQMVLEKYPDKKIAIYNSIGTAGSLEKILMSAVKFIEAGMGFNEIEALLEPIANQKVLFTLACFDNLIKNGRMNPIVGMVATKLNIRAVASNTEAGEIKVLKKCHGEGKTYDELVKLLAERKTDNEKPFTKS